MVEIEKNCIFISSNLWYINTWHDIHTKTKEEEVGLKNEKEFEEIYIHAVDLVNVFCDSLRRRRIATDGGHISAGYAVRCGG